jgi:hypothetical protein
MRSAVTGWRIGRRVGTATDVVTSESDAWGQGGTYTKEEIDSFRNGSAPADLEAPAVSLIQTESRPCQECGNELTGAQVKFCSRSCQKKDAHRRIRHNGAPTLPQEPRNEEGMDDPPSERPALLSPGSLLAELLDAGATLTLVIDGVTVTANR